MPFGTVSSLALGYAAITVLAMIAVGLYQRGLPWGAGFVLRILMAFAISFTATVLLFYAVPHVTLGRGVVGLTLLFSLVGVLSVRSLFLRFAGSDVFHHRVLVLGVGRNAAAIRDLEGPDQLFRVVGFVNLGDPEEVIPPNRQVSLQSSLVDLMVARDADELVVAVDDRRKRLPVDDILDCKMSGMQVMDLVSFFEKEASLVNLDVLQPSWMIFSPGFQRRPLVDLGKRTLDAVGATLMLVVGLPVMAAVVLGILVESRGRGPILFHQTRVGLGGRPFRLHKFRSMRADAEADGVARWATVGDPRVTRFGRFIRKTRLDELPQLLNVLRGEMSLVGPRPERPEFVADLAGRLRYYQERHRVKPGLTGWAQLNYQYGSSIDDAKKKLEYDLYYVKNASLFLDLVILLETVEIVLWGKGAR
ncbi:MAG: TIGR03013 family PEP-CTERM/XrtA system glycosyltransferase [Acidobacteria bacterium]|nr:TIGR03013 family PEP-CTERM/XrtA system glycosyltransferase [Acidobacteriota bacterium]